MSINPLANRPRADACGFGNGLRRLSARDLPYNALSTARRQPGILMHVHPVLRWNLKLQQPQLPRPEPDGQPTESSQLASVAKRIRSMGRVSTQSAPKRATRSSRSPGGVPAAKASGARSRCGVRAEDIMARTLGKSSDDMAKRSRPFLRVRDMANAGDTLLHLTPRDIDLARPRQIMPV